jgi:hypothetical protein
VSTIKSSGENLKLSSDNTKDIELQHNGSTKVIVKSDGNVGIGTTTPDSYYANGLVVASSDVQNGITIVSTTTSQGMFAFADGTSGSSRYSGYIDYNHSSDVLSFGTVGSERMRITSTGNVEMSGNLTVSDHSRIKSGTTVLGGLYRSGAVIGNSDTDISLFAETGRSLSFMTGGSATKRMTIASTGNVGIGVTPASTGGSYVGLDIGEQGSLASYTSSPGGSVLLGRNTYYTGTHRYKHTDEASQIDQTGAGTIKFKVAPSGTADSEISWTDAMTIENDGTMVTSGVKTYYKDLLINGNIAYTFDIDIKSIGASGAIYEVFAGFTHYSGAYGAVLKQIIAHRSTVQADVIVIDTITNHTSAYGGSWSVSYVDIDTIRLTKAAGTNAASGHGYILVRGKS